MSNVLYAVDAAVKLKMDKAGRSLQDLFVNENQRKDRNQRYLQFEWRHYNLRLSADAKARRFLTVTRTGPLTIEIQFMDRPVTTFRRNPVQWWQTDPWIYVSGAGWSDPLRDNIDPDQFQLMLRNRVCRSFRA